MWHKQCRTFRIVPYLSNSLRTKTLSTCENRHIYKLNSIKWWNYVPCELKAITEAFGVQKIKKWKSNTRYSFFWIFGIVWQILMFLTFFWASAHKSVKESLQVTSPCANFLVQRLVIYLLDLTVILFGLIRWLHEASVQFRFQSNDQVQMS